MRRRHYSHIAGAVTAAWPLAARVQERVRRIGALISIADSDPESKARVMARLGVGLLRQAHGRLSSKFANHETTSTWNAA